MCRGPPTLRILGLNCSFGTFTFSGESAEETVLPLARALCLLAGLMDPVCVCVTEWHTQTHTSVVWTRLIF